MAKKEPPPSQIKHFKFVSPPKKKKVKKKPGAENAEGQEKEEEKPKTPKEEEDEEWKKEKERREESLRRAKLWEEKRKAEKRAQAGRGRGRGRGSGRGRGGRPPLGRGRRKVGPSTLDEIPEANEADEANRKSVREASENNDQAAARPETKQTLRPPTTKSVRPITSQSKRPITSQSNRPVTNQSRRDASRLSNRPPTNKSLRPVTSQSNRPGTDKSQRPDTAAEETQPEAVKDGNGEERAGENVVEKEEIKEPKSENTEKETKEAPQELPKEEPKNEVKEEKEEEKQEEPKNEDNQAVAEPPPPQPVRKISVFGKVGLFTKKMFKKVEEKKKLEQEAEEETKEEEEKKEEKEEENVQSEEVAEVEEKTDGLGNDEEKPEEKTEGLQDDKKEEQLKENVENKEDEKKEEEEEKEEAPPPIPEIKEETVEEPKKEETGEEIKEETKEDKEEEESDHENEEPKVEEDEKEKKGFFGLFKRKSKAEDANSISQSRVSLLGRSRVSLQTTERAPSVASKHSVACSPFVFDETPLKQEDPKPPVQTVETGEVEEQEQKEKSGWDKFKTTLFGSGNVLKVQPKVKELIQAQQAIEDEAKPEEYTSEETQHQLSDGIKKDEVPQEELKKEEEVIPKEDVKTSPKTGEQNKTNEQNKTDRPVIIINANPQDAAFSSTLMQALNGVTPSAEGSQAPQLNQQVPGQIPQMGQMPAGMPMMNPLMNPMVNPMMMNPMMNPYMTPYYNQLGFPPMMPPGAMPQYPGNPAAYGFQIPYPPQHQPQPPQFYQSSTREKPAPSVNDTVIISKKKTKDKESSNEVTGAALANFAQKYSAAEVQERVRRKLEEAEVEVNSQDITDEWFEQSDSDDEFYKSEKRKIRRGRRRDILYQQEKTKKKNIKASKKKEEAKIEEEKERERENFQKKMQGLLTLIETGEEVKIAKTPEVKDEEIEEKLTEEREKILNESLRNDVPGMDLESFLKKDEKPKEDDEFAKMLAALNAESSGNKEVVEDGDDQKGDRGATKGSDKEEKVLSKDNTNNQESNKKGESNEGTKRKKPNSLDNVLSNLLSSLNTPTKPLGKGQVDSSEGSGVSGKNDGIEKSEKEQMEKDQPQSVEQPSLFVRQNLTNKDLENLKTSNSIHVSPISSREASGEIKLGLTAGKNEGTLPAAVIGPGGKMTPEQLLYDAQKTLMEAKKVLSPSNAPS